MNTLKQKLNTVLSVSGTAFWVFVLGMAVMAVMMLFNLNASGLLNAGLDVAKKGYGLIGIAIVGLLPLAVWTGRLMVRHISTVASATEKELLDYNYIAVAAPTWGLLGTVIALVLAGAAMAKQISDGSSADRILSIIPMVSQALISTVAGLLIQLAADSALFVARRKTAE